jgi:hypothetical protein
MSMIFLLAMLAGGDATAVSKPADPKSEKVCRRDIRTGTRFTRNVCMSRSAWEARAAADARDLGEMRGRSVAAGGQENRPAMSPSQYCVAGRC